MAPRRARESKQGLIIALVFAVLMVIGLGVTTYFQANAKEAAAKERDEEKKKSAKLTDSIHWYQFQANLYRAYMGQADGIDSAVVGTEKAKLDSGTLTTSEPDKEAVTNLVKSKLDPKFVWDPVSNKPKQTYESLLQQEKERADAADERSKNYLIAKDTAERAAKKASDELKAERAAFDEKLVQLNKKTEVDMSKYLETIKDLRAEITRQGENNDQIRKAASEEKKRAEDTIARLNAKVKDLFTQVDQKKVRIEELVNRGVELAPKDWQTDWKIVSIDRTGQQPYINLGSADRVYPQLTFSIHGQGPDGRPIADPKGSLEVVSVLSDHLAQARVLSVKDRNKEPILKGDILFNPSWSPTAKKHVAIAGTVDLLGNGRDSTVEFIRNLERQNVVIDAYVDPRDNSIKGKGISVQTDYLIVPEGVAEPVAGESDASREVQKKREEAIGKLLQQAKENGVQQIKLPKYLEQIGYRLPRSAVELGSISDRPAAAPAQQPPAEAADPGAPAAPKKDAKAPPDDKPAEDKPK